jgi:hypothetical protein
MITRVERIITPHGEFTVVVNDKLPKDKLYMKVKNEIFEVEMKEQKEFPTYEEFHEWSYANKATIDEVYNYFADRVRTVMPEVGKEYEATTVDGRTWRGKLYYFVIDGIRCKSIRPITIPTRDEVLAKCKALGLTDEELEVLK